MGVGGRPFEARNYRMVFVRGLRMNKVKFVWFVGSGC